MRMMRSPTIVIALGRSRITNSATVVPFSTSSSNSPTSQPTKSKHDGHSNILYQLERTQQQQQQQQQSSDSNTTTIDDTEHEQQQSTSATTNQQDQQQYTEAHRQWHLGLALMRDAKNAQDSKIAMETVHKAADLGEPDALLYLADHYSRVDAKPLTARELALEASERGHSKANTMLGRLWMGAGGHPIDIDKAVRYFHQAADIGEPDAAFQLGVYYSGWYNSPTRTPNGWNGVSQENRQKARHYFKYAASTQHDQAMSVYGMMLVDGIGGEQDEQQGWRLIEQASDIGQPEASFNHAYMLFEHGHIERAFDAYVLAGNKGYAHGFWNAGLMLLNGTLNKPDAEASSRELMRQASELDHMHAAFNYAKMLEVGYGGDADLVAARAMYTKAAQANIVPAMFNLALLLVRGSGGDEDVVQARELFEMAARQNHYGYEHGLQRAIRWLANPRRCCCRAAGQFGIMLYEGIGGYQDQQMAVKFLEVAAEAGDQASKVALARIRMQTANSDNDDTN
jgi:TPR repeat protein